MLSIFHGRFQRWLKRNVLLKIHKRNTKSKSVSFCSENFVSVQINEMVLGFILTSLNRQLLTFLLLTVSMGVIHSNLSNLFILWKIWIILRFVYKLLLENIPKVGNRNDKTLNKYIKQESTRCSFNWYEPGAVSLKVTVPCFLVNVCSVVLT
jgi:hypothetical protein